MFDFHSKAIEQLINRAIADLAVQDDFTTDSQGSARVIGSQDLVCAGLPLAAIVFQKVDPTIEIRHSVNDGDFVREGDSLLQISGNIPAMIHAAHLAFNFMGSLSGLATLVHRFTEQLQETSTKIRTLQTDNSVLSELRQYAIQTGGGSVCSSNIIRLGTSQIELAGGIRAALDQAHSDASIQMIPRSLTAYEAVGSSPEFQGAEALEIQIEVQNEAELREALDAGVESLLFLATTPEAAKQLIELARSLRPDCIIEISGKITIHNAHAYAQTGADFLSPSALTDLTLPARLTLLVDNPLAK